MRVVFLGGASAIGASCLAIEVGDQWLVVDAGVRVGGGSDPLPDLAFLQGKDVALILVTHAHADHIGALPLLHAAFPATPMYATRATNLLMEVMLTDSLKIMSKRAAEELEVPLYTEEQVASTFEWLRPFPVDQAVACIEIADLTITATRAGHVAGAVCLSLDHPSGRLVISGDISSTTQRTVAGAAIPPLTRPDLLILESTYGRQTLHANRQAEEVRLAETVAAIIAAGGPVLIPAFALGRAQEVILVLLAAQGSHQIPRFPIFIDGLVRRVTSAYMQIPEALNPKLSRAIHRGLFPFTGPTVTHVRNEAHREQIVTGPPACIITSSGMLTGGPSAWYAERLVANEKAAILITGYQDEEAPGRRLLALTTDKDKTLVMNGQTYSVRCTVQKYALSAHADAHELAGFAAALHPAAVALVHGDTEARAALATHLTETTIHLPLEGDSIDVQAARRRTAVRTQPKSEDMAPITEYGQGQPPTTLGLIDLVDLLHAQDTQRVSVTLRELAYMWYGTPTGIDEATLADVVATLPDWFVPIADLAGVYRLSTNAAESADPMQSLIGHVLLIRLSDEMLVPAYCQSVRASGVAIITPQGAHGRHRILPRDIVEDLGRAPEEMTEALLPDHLKALDKEAKKWRKRLTRADLIDILRQHPDHTYSLDEAAVALGTLREDMSQRLAVAHMLNDTADIVRSAAQWEWGGPGRYSLHPDAPAPTAAPRQYANTANLNSAIDAIFVSAPDLYKRGFDPHSGAITLYFYFPAIAAQTYATELQTLTARTGVAVTIAPHARQDRLMAEALRLLPTGATALRQPSILFDQQAVLVTYQGKVGASDSIIAQNEFLARTGWKLRIVAHDTPAVAATTPKELEEPVIVMLPGDASAATIVTDGAPAISTVSLPLPVPQVALPTTAAAGMPVPDLLKLSRSYLPDTLGITRRTMQPNGHIAVGTLFPDAAKRDWAEPIARFLADTGTTIDVVGSVNQLALAQVARTAVPPSVRVAKSIAIYAEQRQVKLRYEGELSADEWQLAQQRFAQQTGWEMLGEALPAPTLPVMTAANGPMDQSAAINVVKAYLPPLTGLYKVSANAATNTLTLRFHFPDVARVQQHAIIEQLHTLTRWQMEIAPHPQTQALESATRAVVPVSVVVTHVGIESEHHQIVATCRGPLTNEQIAHAQSAFQTQTGWTLIFESR